MKPARQLRIEFLVACREVIDDAEGIALLDARRKHIGVAEPVLRKRVPRALWGIWPRGQAAECVIAAVAAIVLARDVDDLPVISGAFSNSLKLYPRAQFLFFLRHEE